jgi:hypothetical protein
LNTSTICGTGAARPASAARNAPEAFLAHTDGSALHDRLFGGANCGLTDELGARVAAAGSMIAISAAGSRMDNRRSLRLRRIGSRLQLSAVSAAYRAICNTSFTAAKKANGPDNAGPSRRQTCRTPA